MVVVPSGVFDEVEDLERRRPGRRRLPGMLVGERTRLHPLGQGTRRAERDRAGSNR